MTAASVVRTVLPFVSKWDKRSVEELDKQIFKGIGDFRIAKTAHEMARGERPLVLVSAARESWKGEWTFRILISREECTVNGGGGVHQYIDM